MTRSSFEAYTETAAEAMAGHCDEAERKDSLIAELRRQVDAGLRVRDQAVAAARSAQAAAWQPTGRLSRTLTDEQKASARADHARADWPAWIQPCDPTVSVADGTVSIGCAETSGVIVQTGTCRWSELVGAVAPHQCPKGEST
jgi:hypothetical protein